MSHIENQRMFNMYCVGYDEVEQICLKHSQPITSITFMHAFIWLLLQYMLEVRSELIKPHNQRKLIIIFFHSRQEKEPKIESYWGAFKPIPGNTSYIQLNKGIPVQYFGKTYRTVHYHTTMLARVSFLSRVRGKEGRKVPFQWEENFSISLKGI